MVDDSGFTPDSGSNIFVPKLGPQVSYRRLVLILLIVALAAIVLSFVADPDHHKLKSIARGHAGFTDKFEPHSDRDTP